MEPPARAYTHPAYLLQPQEPVQWLHQTTTAPLWFPAPTPSLLQPPINLLQQWRHNIFINPAMTPQGPRRGPAAPALLPDFVYHYTDQAGFVSIMNSGRLFASGLWKPKGTVYGKGVYLTALPPSSSTAELMTNNYGNPSYCASRNMVAKSEYAFQFRCVDLCDLRAVGGGAGRNVFLCPRPWIELKACPFMMAYKRSFEDGQQLGLNSLNRVELVWRTPLIA